MFLLLQCLGIITITVLLEYGGWTPVSDRFLIPSWSPAITIRSRRLAPPVCRGRVHGGGGRIKGWGKDERRFLGFLGFPCFWEAEMVIAGMRAKGWRWRCLSVSMMMPSHAECERR
ncbi:hypothetical protein B0T18DRAFT_412247 [Schizothecium vesticola]|uniref:Uncharacterized protein n=1 Tax=Schizothecium vesticola TaxID=314040 RepID=A0AA40EWM0_9PEZI|nr:hypothetical protein B0T18DRAFT_412247 [Schizothecium vesticola]